MRIHLILAAITLYLIAPHPAARAQQSASVVGLAPPREYTGISKTLKQNQLKWHDLFTEFTKERTAAKQAEDYQKAYTVALMLQLANQIDFSLLVLTDAEFLHSSIKDPDTREISAKVLFEQYGVFLMSADTLVNKMTPQAATLYPALGAYGTEFSNVLSPAFELATKRIEEIRKEAGLPPAQQ